LDFGWLSQFIYSVTDPAYNLGSCSLPVKESSPSDDSSLLASQFDVKLLSTYPQHIHNILFEVAESGNFALFSALSGIASLQP